MPKLTIAFTSDSFTLREHEPPYEKLTLSQFLLNQHGRKLAKASLTGKLSFSDERTVPSYDPTIHDNSITTTYYATIVQEL